MSNLLNCTDLVQTYESLEKILRGNVGKFILQNTKRISFDNGCYWNYDHLSIQDIKNYFNIDLFDFDEIVVNHVVAIINKQSFLNTGLLNLGSLARVTDNDFSNFLQHFNILFKVDSNGNPFFEFNGRKITSDYVQNRLTKDQCINGFLFGYSCFLDRNVSDIRECPEIISHIGREIINIPQLKDTWIEKSTPSFISFRVNINDIDTSTFNGDLTHKEKKEFFILKTIEYLLFTHTHYPIEHLMIYLKETVDIPPGQILNINELEQSENYY